MIKDNDTSTKSVNATLKTISEEELKHFGVDHIGYIKRVKNDTPERPAQYQLFAADGRKIGRTRTRQDINILISESEINTVTVH